MKKWVIGASAAAVAVMSWNLLGAGSSERAAPVAADERIEAIESDLAQLSRQTRTAQRRVNQLATTWQEVAPPIPRVPGGDDEGTEPAAETNADEPPPIPLEDALEQSFDEDTVVTEWSQSAASEAKDALAPVLPDGSSLDRVECRGSLCRVEIVHDKAEGHDEFTYELMHSPPRWMGPGSYQRVPGTNGRDITLAYLGRPGSDFEPDSIWGAPSRP